MRPKHLYLGLCVVGTIPPWVVMPRLWLPIAASLIVGVSLGLPLLLYMREGRREASVGALPIVASILRPTH